MTQPTRPAYTDADVELVARAIYDDQRGEGRYDASQRIGAWHKEARDHAASALSALTAAGWLRREQACNERVEHQRDLATDQRAAAYRIVEESRLEAAALLNMERQHAGHGRDGHLNEDDLAPLLTALQITPADPATAGEAPTWEDVWAAIGREVWKLAPQEFQDAGHRDLVFGTCWQNVMEAVQNGIVAVAALPDEDQP